MTPDQKKQRQNRLMTVASLTLILGIALCAAIWKLESMLYYRWAIALVLLVVSGYNGYLFFYSVQHDGSLPQDDFENTDS